MLDDRFWAYSLLLVMLLGFFVVLKADEVQPGKESVDSLVRRLAKPYDLEKTVRTLIKLESNDGLYPINLQDPACGLTHINIKTYIRRHKITDTKFNRNKACADLIASPELAIANAIEELLYWKTVHCKRTCSVDQYARVIKSYNTGWNYNGSKANEYWLKFKKELRRLK